MKSELPKGMKFVKIIRNPHWSTFAVYDISECTVKTMKKHIKNRNFLVFDHLDSFHTAKNIDTWDSHATLGLSLLMWKYIGIEIPSKEILSSLIDEVEE